MSYTEQTWADGDPTKPVSAARLQHIEDGLAAVANGGSRSYAWYDPRLQWLGQSLERALVAADQSFSMAWLSDSTANDKPSGANTGDWPYEVGAKIASAFPAWTARWRVWDDATQDYDAPVTIQTGATATARSVRFPGTGFSYTLPKSLVASAPTNLCVDVLASLDAWVPAANQTIAAHEAGAGNRSWWLTVVPSTGRLNLTWSNDGTTITTKASTVAPTVSNGSAIWIRATLRVDNGASGSDVKFWTSPDGATWTQLGTTVTTAGTTTLFDATAPYYIGSRTGGNTELITGNVYEVRVRAGIPGIDAACHTILPTFAEQWEPVSSTSPNGAVGDPVLDIFAGAVAGKGIYGANAYLNDSTRLPIMLPLQSIRAVFLASAKNDGNAGTDQGYLAAWTAWITSVKSRLNSDVVPVVCTEPPTISGTSTTAQSIRADRMRREKLLTLAANQGYPALDQWQSIVDTGQVTHYMNADGLHPRLDVQAGDTYSGSQIIANDAYRAMFSGTL